MSTETKEYFEIPVNITIKSTISVAKDDACDLGEAIFLAKKIFAQRHEIGSVLDFVECEEVSKEITVDSKLARELNPPKTYTVTVQRIQECEVTVEAYSEDDAQTEAIELVENGDVPSVDWTDCEVTAESVDEND